MHYVRCRRPPKELDEMRNLAENDDMGFPKWEPHKFPALSLGFHEILGDRFRGEHMRIL